MVKNPPVMQENWVHSLGWEDPLEKEMATHSSILAWRISWTEDPGRLQSTRSQRFRYDWTISLSPYLQKESSPRCLGPALIPWPPNQVAPQGSSAPSWPLCSAGHTRLTWTPFYRGLAPSQGSLHPHLRPPIQLKTLTVVPWDIASSMETRARAPRGHSLYTHVRSTHR